MLTLRIKFDRCANPQAALAAIRVRPNQAGLRLQGDLLHLPAAGDQNVRLGRSWSCDVYLLDADTEVGGVAKEHLQIEVTSQVCFVRDLATKNGTLLNGKWLGGPPLPYSSPASRTPSGRKQIKVGDVIQLPGMTLTVVEIPAGGPRLKRSSAPPPLSPSLPTPEPARPDPAKVPGTPQLPPPAESSQSSAFNPQPNHLPPVVTFQPAESPVLPPSLKGFKFAATLGGKPASGLTYLYERKRGQRPSREKWVVKYVSPTKPVNLETLRQLLAAFFGVQHAALHHPHAYAFVPSANPTHLALCFHQLQGANLARSPLLDLAGIHDLLTGALGALAALHQQGLAHGHICASNMFLAANGRLALTDCGLNAIRSLIGAELTGPIPSARHDLTALGELCLNLLGTSGATPEQPFVEPTRQHQPDWPGAPLQALAGRLRQDSQLTASQALQLLQAVPRPQVKRLLTVPEWGG